MSRPSQEQSGTPSRRTLLVFQVADQQYAVSSAEVAEVLPMAELHCPPGLPKLLAGFLNVAGDLIPVIRLHHLFDLPSSPLEAWTPLIVVRASGRRLALLADSVSRTLVIDDDAILPLPRQQAADGCVIGIVRCENVSTSLLSPEHLLLEQETRVIAQLQQCVRQRIGAVEGIIA